MEWINLEQVTEQSRLPVPQRTGKLRLESTFGLTSPPWAGSRLLAVNLVLDFLNSAMVNGQITLFFRTTMVLMAPVVRIVNCTMEQAILPKIIFCQLLLTAGIISQ